MFFDNDDERPWFFEHDDQKPYEIILWLFEHNGPKPYEFIWFLRSQHLFCLRYISLDRGPLLLAPWTLRALFAFFP